RLDRAPSPGVADDAHHADRLAGRAAARTDAARTAAAGSRLALEPSSPPLLPPQRAAGLALDDGFGPARDGARRGDADQDLEQRADRAPAAGAGKAAPRSQDRSAGEPDQPALPLQHAGVDFVADPHEAGNRPYADHQALGHASPADAQHGPLRDAA